MSCQYPYLTDVHPAWVDTKVRSVWCASTGAAS